MLFYKPLYDWHFYITQLHTSKYVFLQMQMMTAAASFSTFGFQLGSLVKFKLYLSKLSLFNSYLQQVRFTVDKFSTEAHFR